LLAANNRLLVEQKRCWRRGFAQKVGTHVVRSADEVKVAQRFMVLQNRER
jgi:hypothetical protein